MKTTIKQGILYLLTILCGLIIVIRYSNDGLLVGAVSILFVILLFGNSKKPSESKEREK